MSTKRDHLVSTALHLFYEQGVHAMGINEVLKQANVAKKTLYTHFASKDDLVLAALEVRHERFLQWLSGRLISTSNDADFVNQLFDALDDWFNGRAKELGAFRGCFFINVSSEFNDPTHPISLACKRHKTSVLELLSQTLPSQSRSIAESLCLLKEGAITQAYVRQDLNAALKAKSIGMALIEPH